MTVQCCSCKKIRKGTQWVNSAEPESTTYISHGYCPACVAKVYAELQTVSPKRLVANGRA